MILIFDAGWKYKIQLRLNTTQSLKIRHLEKQLREKVTKLTPSLMEPVGSMPHWQGLSNNSYPEPNQPNSPHWYLSLQGPF